MPNCPSSSRRLPLENAESCVKNAAEHTLEFVAFRLSRRSVDRVFGEGPHLGDEASKAKTSTSSPSMPIGFEHGIAEI